MPLTRPHPVILVDKVKDHLDADGFIEGLVEVTLQEIIEEDYQGLHKLLAERLIGAEHQEKLTELEYTLESCTPKTLLFMLRANTKLLLPKALD